jgi:hypothetical protein
MNRAGRVALDEAGLAEVTRAVADRGWRCSGCGGARARVDEVLDLGLLFRGEDPDTYLVELCCCNPTCAQPRDGIRLVQHELAPPDPARPGRAR